MPGRGRFCLINVHGGQVLNLLTKMRTVCALGQWLWVGTKAVMDELAFISLLAWAVGAWWYWIGGTTAVESDIFV